MQVNSPSKNIHLIISVYLTDIALTPAGFYGKNISSSQNKVDQFLSTIHSVSKINFSSAEIHFECDKNYQIYEPLIQNFIKDHVPQAIIYSNRMEYFKDWHESAERIPKGADLVLLKTNHDHVFVPPTEFEFRVFADSISTFPDNWIGEISHWPESLGNLRDGRWTRTPDNKISTFNSWANHTIGTCLIPTSFFRSWWRNDFTDGSRIVRPDNPFGPWVTFPSTMRIVPAMEFFRHLDGYGYAKVNAPIASAIRSCCRVNENQISHTEWTKGRFILNIKKYDLPVSPSLKIINSITTGIELILLASAYKVNLRNIVKVISSFKFKGLIMVMTPILFFNKYFLQKLFNLLLPIYAGNIKLFKTRIKIINLYKKLHSKYPKLPPNIRSIFRTKDNSTE